MIMTKDLLTLLSLWAGLSKEVKEAIEYSVRSERMECELWLTEDTTTKKILNQLGFDVEIISKEGLSKEYIKISWKNL